MPSIVEELRRRVEEGTRAWLDYGDAVEDAARRIDNLPPSGGGRAGTGATPRETVGATFRLPSASPAALPGTLFGPSGALLSPPGGTPPVGMLPANAGPDGSVPNLLYQRSPGPGANVTASSSSQGGGSSSRGTGADADLVFVQAIDGNIRVQLRELKARGEATVIGWFGGLRNGWVYQGFHFLDPGAGPATVAGSGSGGTATGAPVSRLVTVTTSGPDGGADVGRRRVRSSTVTIDPVVGAVDRMRSEVAGKLDRLSTQLQGGGIADALRRAR